MQRCKTCKHWDSRADEYYFGGEVPGTNTCRAVPEIWGVTQWSKDGETREMKPEHIGRLAFVQDGSDYHAALKTLPDFGCVQHEPS